MRTPGLKVIEAAQQETKILESTDLSEEDFSLGLTDIANRKEISLAAVDNRYVEPIAILEEEIQVLREQMAAYDAEKVQQAQEYEAVIDNEKKRFEVEKEQLIASYENQLAEQEADFNARLEEYSGFQNELESTLKDTSAGRQSRLFMLFNPIITENQEELFGLVSQPMNEARLDFDLYPVDPRWIQQGYLNQDGT